ncbi:MAG: DUF6311 domain-containing protein [Asticcacaulis sp.]|uniref:DUF6311 domain-containing protein n=1 Tax=Asticcacaulis sp. TaxID=1872648 RepID=UPI003F7C4F54
MRLPDWRLLRRIHTQLSARLSAVPAPVTRGLTNGVFVGLFIAAPVLLFLAFFNPWVLDPTRIGWLMEADWGQHFLGWNAFRHVSWSSFNHEGLLYHPTGLSVIYTDSNPLFAFIFKPFRALLPQPFQYIGPWFAFCIAMHVIFAFKLIRPHAPNRWAALGGALALSALPCLYYRERHDTLMSQWLLLWGLHLFINVRAAQAAPDGPETLRQKIFRIWDAKTRGYMALLGVTGMIHPYMLFMVAAIWSGEVLRGLWPVVQALRDKTVWPKLLASVAWRAVAVLACPLVTLGIAGAYERGQSPAAGGWSYYSMGLDALFNPVRSDFSAILKAWPLDAGQSFEGYQYLGFGILCLLAVAVALYALTPEAKAARPFLRGLTPLALPFLALFLIAVTNHAQFYGYTVWRFDIPKELRGTLGILRASGRFFWPISYLMVAAALVVLFKSRPRVIAVVLPSILLIQAYDINGLAAAMRKATGLAEYSQTYYLTPSPMWDELVKRSTGVDFYPVNVHLNDKLFYELTYRATTDAKPVNTMYPARENLIQLAYEYKSEDAFRDGQVNPNHLLVFLKQCDAPANLQPRLRMLDGVWIIPPADADDLNLPKPQWSPIRSEVRFGWLDQGTCLLEGDWSRPEYDGVWTQSDQAGVVIPIQHVQFDTATPPKRLDLDLKARSRAPTTVSVLVNGIKAGELEIGRKTARYTLRLPKSALRADMLKIRFVLKADEKTDKKALATVTLPSAPSVAGRSAPKSKTQPVTPPSLGIKLMDLRLIGAAEQAVQAGKLSG